MVSLVVLAVFLLWETHSMPWTAAFKPLFSDGSFTHREITHVAMLRKTAEVCRDIATAQGQDFTLTIENTMTASAVQKACSRSPASSSVLSATRFHLAIAETYFSNAAIDLQFMLSAKHHIDNEAFGEGRDLITQGVATVKAGVQRGSYISARVTLGALCHTLQDFYSHSNWVELGFAAPFSNLIRPDQPLNNLAGPNTQTCRNCNGENCGANILPEILQQKKLTSGYFSISSSTKPAGKCSHGGFFDRTSSAAPTGGINKDTVSSNHGIYHHRAADLATKATMDILEDIRLATGNQAFLRLMGLRQTSVLAFVIDTTGSMSDDIDEAKRVSFSIIDSRRGTSEEPSEYVLVPFNDPDFGPLTRTENADVFKERINTLLASGGGDLPEMCLSGLQMALAGAPPSSDIFVFTDAAAKDIDLLSTIKAMIESTKSRVTFMLTSPFSFRRKRGVFASQRVYSRSMSQSEMQFYRDLAHASGGQAIEVTKTTLSQATEVIMDSTISALVTVLQVIGSSANAENISFLLDSSLSNVTVYITGVSPHFTLYSPTGVSQSGSVPDGPLGSIQTVGNLWRVKLNSDNQTGEWSISITSTSTYTIKVFGQSSVDFLFNFVEQSEGGDFTPKDNRPFIGRNATLFLSVTREDLVTVTDVLLAEVSGSDTVNGTVTSVGGSGFLVYLQRIPEGAFVIHLKGLLNDSSSTDRFQRQSPTQLRGSRVAIAAQSNGTIDPANPFSVSFTLASNGSGGHYTIRARNDRSFIVSVPSSLNVEAGGSAQGTLTLTAPPNTESGTDVTLTIEAEDPGSTDSNYVTLRLTVMAEVTDVSRPVCNVVSIKADCPVKCGSASWELTANLTDGIGSGISSVSINAGNGSLSISNAMSENGTNVTVAFYNASCCSQEVELVAVDGVGNVGTCFTSIKHLTAKTTTLMPATITTTNRGYSVLFPKYLLLFVYLLW
ncbi:von Willebrand factor A domain-containing protein 7 [Triplophysa dalaica]|uniref:von Willebrand factor A domain-containing protein 7 n=1 Tax=Triplophysa dalaica TaxID=1582913 RepID=UPI0024DFCA7B|nr:von Willebrand factor A domain-containing protein 7 [Triplophysa dalaica]